MRLQHAPSKAALQCLRSLASTAKAEHICQLARPFATSPIAQNQVQTEATPKDSFYRSPDPATVFVPRLERRLTRAGTPPIGSRRRRVALHGTSNVPFEQLPYQCFQEARKILLADREEKIKQIAVERARIARLREADPELSGGELRKQNRLRSMHRTLEKLKILADINDPLVKKRFEDGLGDMNKPIYRYLADRKWREYRRPVLVQRITQMKIIPDVVANFEPTADVRLAFGSQRIQPGDFVESTLSENPCRLSVQLFDRGEQLVTIAVVDPDVPNVEKDGFDYRCHFLASNIPITPTSPFINLAKLSSDSQILLPWLPPFAHKGSPYHRISVLILQQKDNVPIDINIAKAKVQHDKFILRSFITRHMLKPFSVTLFRNKWDEGTAGVMTRAGIPGADIELKRIKVEPLPYKRRNPSSFR